MHKILYRPIIVISLVLGMLVMVELLALGSITWRNLSRIDKIKQDISQGHELEQLVLDLLKAPAQTAGEEINPSLENTELHKKITHFFANRQADENGTEALLEEIKPFLLNIEQGKRQDISQVLSVSQKIFNLQRSNEEKLLTQVYEDSRLELNFAVVIPIAVLLPAFLLGIRFFRRQILSPLNSLEQ
jgi:two-component system, NtrC family, sensor kinase